MSKNDIEIELSSSDSDQKSSSESSDDDIVELPSKRTRRSNAGSLEIVDREATNWTMDEKVNFFNGLKIHGSCNLRNLCCYAPSKTEAEIKEFVLRCEKRARGLIKEESSNGGEASIDKWIQLLTKIIPTDDHKLMHLARVFKYIALFEDRVETTDVVLKDAYEIIAALLSGNAPEHVCRNTSSFLLDSLQILAKEVKHQENAVETNCLKTYPRPTVKRCYGKQKENKIPGLADIIINPLTIPEEILKK